jgi:N-acetylmuramoyl-L-alanine amidase
LKKTKTNPSLSAKRAVTLLVLFAALAPGSFSSAAPARSAPRGQTDTRAEVYNLRSYTHPNFTRIVVDIGVVREYTAAESREAGQINVDIFQARLNPIVSEGSVPSGGDYIGAVRLMQKSPLTVRLTAAVNFSRIKRYQVFHVLDPFRIVIDIFPLDPGEAPEPAPLAAGKTAPPSKQPTTPVHPAQPARSGYSMARQLGLGVRTIVIDPGHGGVDPGCLDDSGHLEKEVNLDISLRLKALLVAHRDIDVILTRETDILVPLETRTVLANQKKADLFISVHVNAFRDKGRRGVETFFLNFSPDPRVNELAARENATTTKTIGEMDKIIRKIVESSKIIESRELAQKIQTNLVQCLSRQYSDIRDLGAKGGPFWTLIGSGMPSVLVEVSHFSNPKEAVRLMDPAYRQKIAQGIYDGLLGYIQSLGKG